jgi:hypothetical protein
MIDLRDFVTAEQLKDGTAVTVRAVRPDDKGRIVTAFRELEPETIYTRYFQHKVDLSFGGRPRWISRGKSPWW